MFPHLLKLAEIRLEVIAGMSVSSAEPGNLPEASRQADSDSFTEAVGGV